MNDDEFKSLLDDLFLKSPLRPEADPSACQHARLEQPEFDEEAAQGLDASEVKKRWPRAEAKCPDCGAWVVSYASFAHYIYGDW